METKEKKREKSAPSKKRPAAKSAVLDRRAPARTARPQRPQADPNASYEVYVPDAESQRARHAADARDTAPARAPRKASAAPRKRRPTAGQDADYQPYRRANQRSKVQKKQNLRQRVARFFSYQNPVAKLFYKEDPSVFGDDASAVRREKRAAEAERKRKRAERLNTPAAIYTQPTSFNSRRLAIQMITILGLVLALVLGMSVFFKVENVAVVGAQSYSPEAIRDQAGIKKGENLLTLGRTKASGKIIANLPYVKSARIGIKLPDTVIIEIEESPVLYSIQDQDGVWWLINSDGKVAEQTNAQTARGYTKVLGVTIYQPQAGEAAVATETAPTETDPSGESIPVLITGMQRLNAALKILQELELNDIVGDAASVDVSQLQDIILWYGTQYQVNLGDIDRIEMKIPYMKSAIAQMSDYQTGILDISFTTWTNEIGYTPFG